MTIKTYLTSHGVPYRVYLHEETFDSQHLAQELGVSSKNVAKTVMLRADHGFRYFVLLLPASERVDLERLSKALGGANIRLATELEIEQRCPDCAQGIVTPFGSHINAQTLVDESLVNHKHIFIQGDSHREALRIRYDDFVKLEYPTVVSAIVTDVSTDAPQIRCISFRCQGDLPCRSEGFVKEL